VNKWLMCFIGAAIPWSALIHLAWLATGADSNIWLVLAQVIALCIQLACMAMLIRFGKRWKAEG